MERPVRAVRVVVLNVLLQHHCEVALSDDQKVVEAFAAQRADQALDDRVSARCSNRGADDAGVDPGEHRVAGGGEFAVPVAGHEPHRCVWVAWLHPRSRRAPLEHADLVVQDQDFDSLAVSDLACSTIQPGSVENIS
jgi:hypothetical protein